MMPSPFDDIFGGSGPQWTKDQIIARIRGEADRQKVDPDLAVAVATQESYLNPNAKGDNGKSLGLFQLQPGAAQDAGINPQWRDDPSLNIYGGVRYLKLKLDQSKGNVQEALRRYNGGGDPNYVANVTRHLPGQRLARTQPGMLARVADVFSPASAEAATPPQAASSPVWDDIFGAPQPPQAPQPPPLVSQTAPAPSTPPGASQAPPAPSPDPTATSGMRFQALPSITQLEPADRIQKTRDFERLTPEMQEEFLRSEEPAAGGLAMGGGPVRQAQPVTDPAALLAGGRGTRPAAPAAPVAAPPPRGPASSTQIEPLQPGASELALSEFQRPHEQGIPLEAVPAIAVNTLGTVGGAALGAPLGPVGSAAGAALGGSLATRANTALGLAPQEQPLLETPFANVYPSDLLGAIP